MRSATVRKVRKGPEPTALAAARREARRIERDTGRPLVAHDWELLRGPEKVEVGRRLYEDQDGLCAYCGGRLRRPDGDRGLKIEHFVPRSVDPSRMFDWDNLLAVCDGRTLDERGAVLHCDSHRTPNTLLHVHPALDPDPSARLEVSLKDFEIVPRDAGAISDVGELNLNIGVLTQNRRRVVEELRKRLARGDTPSQLLRQYSAPAPAGLPPYAHVAQAYLRRKLRQRGVPTSGGETR